MSGIESQHQLEVTREKLAWLEKRYIEAKARPIDNPLTRELSLRSIKKFINQMKEEIARFETHGLRPRDSRNPIRGIQNERQLEVTREKRACLEEQYAEAKQRAGSDRRIHELTLRSLKQMINQMTEEIVRFETRQNRIKAPPVTAAPRES